MKLMSDRERILRENIVEPDNDFIELVKSNLSEIEISECMNKYACSREEAEQHLAEYIAWNLKNS